MQNKPQVPACELTKQPSAKAALVQRPASKSTPQAASATRLPGAEQVAEADVRLNAVERLLTYGLAGGELSGLDELAQAALQLTGQARRFMELAGFAQ